MPHRASVEKGAGAKPACAGAANGRSRACAMRGGWRSSRIPEHRRQYYWWRRSSGADAAAFRIVWKKRAGMSYRIKRVAKITGINPATLRAWERRYNLIAPGRTDSGYRLYSDDDVAMLSRIKQFTSEGLTIGEAIARVRRTLTPLPPDPQEPQPSHRRAPLRDALPLFGPA